MFCSNCGAQLQDGSKFCNMCGSPVTSSTSEKEISTSNNEGNTSSINEDMISKLQCLQNVLMELEANQYLINLCENGYKYSTKKGSLGKAAQFFLNPANGINDYYETFSQLKKNNISFGYAGKGLLKKKEELEEKNKDIVAKSYQLGIVGLIPDRYLCSDYVRYMLNLISEKRVSSMQQAYDALDEYIHRNNLESAANTQNGYLSAITNMLSTSRII